MKLVGGIELGGTKVVCVAAEGPEKVTAEARFPTTSPEETLSLVTHFFKNQMQKHDFSAIGIGTFGPVDLNPQSSTYGFITSTPKSGWQNFDILTRIKSELTLPIVIDTDVNAAALGELYWGNGFNMDPFVYITIGTGIGMGGWINQRLMHGMGHPEAGHIILARDKEQDPFRGICPFHENCWEGLASGPAIHRRWGQPPESLAKDHPAWKFEAEYISQALVNVILILSPQRIVLGGGVMQQTHLFPAIRSRVVELLNGYLQCGEILEHMDQFILPPAFGQKAGVMGCIALAKQI